MMVAHSNKKGFKMAECKICKTTRLDFGTISLGWGHFLCPVCHSLQLAQERFVRVCSEIDASNSVDALHAVWHKHAEIIALWKKREYAFHGEILAKFKKKKEVLNAK